MGIFGAYGSNNAGSTAGAGATTDTSGGGTDWAKWAEMALQAYSAYQKSQPGKFQQVPQDPSQIALRNQLMGYMQNSPTRNMLGGLLGPAIERSAGSSFQLPPGANGYMPYKAPAPKYDMSAILGSISTPSNPSAGSNANGINAVVPPPPPDVIHATKKNRYNETARGLLGFFGINGGHNSNLQKADASQQSYDQWKQQWGQYFTDATGKPITPPSTLAEYEAWYQARYGRPFQG